MGNLELEHRHEIIWTIGDRSRKLDEREPYITLAHTSSE